MPVRKSENFWWLIRKLQIRKFAQKRAVFLIKSALDCLKYVFTHVSKSSINLYDSILSLYFNERKYCGSTEVFTHIAKNIWSANCQIFARSTSLKILNPRICEFANLRICDLRHLFADCPPLNESNTTISGNKVIESVHFLNASVTVGCYQCKFLCLSNSNEITDTIYLASVTGRCNRY